ncbi:cupin-like domain-containing protein [Sphingomonas sp.]|uniref:cupin-like domain-containing protein n=1 Tax=Sphingomonas sp. TaxID=28214 RepID=UPI000DB03002|nr:cupin-like domain-containing protein [Sphingomonas sp.]PZU08783.1 MAG: cupin-like domain-containing protein [Sphingomonas sp.]
MAVDPAWLADGPLFRSEIAARCKPVLLPGLLRDWPAVREGAASPAALARYLARFATDREAQAFVGEPGIAGRYSYGANLEGFNFERIDMDVMSALERLLAAQNEPLPESFYMGSIPADMFLPGFAEENRIAIVPPSVSPRLWIGSASHIACHYDTYDNVAGVIAGRRRFTLYPPEAIESLYVGPIDHTMAGQPIALAEGSSPGDPRYPDFEAMRDQAIMFDLAEGDALYIPKLWWHRVDATAPFNMLVNYWWDAFSNGTDAPYTTMLLAMIALAERPEAERQSWRAFFDHYVFRPQGHPLRHLPEAKHGILGALANGNYGRIRAHVMQMLRRG